MPNSGFAKEKFKRVLRTLFLNILEKEDDYIQIPAINEKVGETSLIISFYLYYYFLFTF